MCIWNHFVCWVIWRAGWPLPFSPQKQHLKRKGRAKGGNWDWALVFSVILSQLVKDHAYTVHAFAHLAWTTWAERSTGLSRLIALPPFHFIIFHIRNVKGKWIWTPTASYRGGCGSGGRSTCPWVRCWAPKAGTFLHQRVWPCVINKCGKYKAYEAQ